MIASLALLAGGSVSVVSAAEFMAPAKGDQSGTVTVGSTEQHKNLYVAGGTVVVNGKTMGDLYAAGGTVDVTNDVEQDAVVAGGNISLDGKVGGDVRVAGGTVKISAPIAGDVLAFGGTLILSERSSVGGDLVAAGGSISIDAPINGNILASGGSIIINAPVKGTITLGKSGKGQKVIFGPKADVAGKFIVYGSGSIITKQDGAKVGDPEYRAGRTPKRATGVLGGIIASAIIIKLIASILAILLILKLFPRRSQEAVSGFLQDPWANLGIGFVGLIVIPVIAIIALVILVGYYAAFILAAWYFFMLALAGLVTMLFAGAWIIKMLTKRPELKVDWQAAVIGAVAMLVLGWIPIVGWIAAFVLFCMGFGTLLRMAKIDMKTNQ